MNPGQKVKDLRKRIGLTQTRLAEETGITLRTIQRIENDEVTPSLHSLQKLSEILGENLNTLASAGPEGNELIIKINLTEMKQLFDDLKILLKKHSKTILIFILVVLFLYNYPDIKAGILDGWNGR
jgi:transcriptional regulator with XRE-family HTH domain